MHAIIDMSYTPRSDCDKQHWKRCYRGMKYEFKDVYYEYITDKRMH